MDKRPFTIVIVILAVTFSAISVMRYYRPPSAADVSFDDFPLALGEWTGVRRDIPPAVIELLNPKAIFSAAYTNSEGVQVDLLFDFFSSESSIGGPHSPRNCLPGQGWIILETVENRVEINDRTIPANRFELRHGDTRQVMDFWYVTNYGETANDYVFKLYQVLSSLTLKPKEVAFVSFTTNRQAKSLAALEQFEKLATKEIYSYLPFTSGQP